MKFTILAIMSVFSISASAVNIKITSPAAGSNLSASTVIKGDCKGKKEVGINGPGIEKGKKISCQKEKYFEYSLSNAFKKMPHGKIVIKISQGDDDIQMTFNKGGTTTPTEPQEPQEPQPPEEKRACTFSSKSIAHGKTVTAYRELEVAFGQPCTSEQRVCNDGKLSGTFAHASCKVAEGQQEPQQPVGDLDPNKVPGQNFDLRQWKITLPVDKSGNKSGVAVEVLNLSNYEQEQYFYTAADGAMVFIAPTDGARTSGSKYPRSELREMTQSGEKAAWTVEQGGEFHATMSVNELPVASSGAQGRIVVGQIHGPDDELCRLYYDNGKMYYADDKAGSSQKETTFNLISSSGALSNIPLNDKFDYSIIADQKNLTVRVVHKGVEYLAVTPHSKFWPGKALYFKAGAYVQVSKPGSGAGTVGTGQGKVSFYKLTAPQH